MLRDFDDALKLGKIIIIIRINLSFYDKNHSHSEKNIFFMIIIRHTFLILFFNFSGVDDVVAENTNTFEQRKNYILEFFTFLFFPLVSFSS
jgi:hypothetical protein